MPGRRRLIILKVLQVIVAGLVAAAAYLREYRPVQQPPGLGAYLHAEFLAWYVPIMLGLVMISTAAQALQHLLGSEAKDRVRGALDTLVRACFPEVAEEERYHNRATLFQARRGMLRGYARSGTAFQTGIPNFRIDDNNEATNVGVAGRAWFTNATAHAANLPEWSADDAARKAYAVAGYLTVQQAAKLRVPSRSVFATPVRDLHGRRWGVLVVDARRPEPFTEGQQALIRTFAGALGTMV